MFWVAECLFFQSVKMSRRHVWVAKCLVCKVSGWQNVCLSKMSKCWGLENGLSAKCWVSKCRKTLGFQGPGQARKQPVALICGDLVIISPWRLPFCCDIFSKVALITMENQMQQWQNICGECTKYCSLKLESFLKLNYSTIGNRTITDLRYGVGEGVSGHSLNWASDMLPPKLRLIWGCLAFSEEKKS